MLDPHREIQALVDNFVADLSELAKRIAIEQVMVAFDVGAKLSAGVGAKLSAGVGARPSAGVVPKRVAGVPKRAAGVVPKRVAAGPKRVAAKPAPPAPDRASRARRGQGEIEALRGKLLAAIAEQPGRRTEDLNAALGTRTTQIAALLRRLVADKLVRTEGARRGMRYFAAAAGDAQSSRRAAAATTAAAASVAAAAAADEAAAAAADPPA